MDEQYDQYVLFLYIPRYDFRSPNFVPIVCSVTVTDSAF